MKENRNTIPNLLSLFIIVMALVGSWQTIFRSGEGIGDNDLLYFTIQSNIWIALIHIYSVLGPELSHRIRTLRFVLTVSITLTFIVFFVLLVPELGWFVVELPGAMATHFWAPLAAIIHFLFFEKELEVQKGTVFYSIIPPLLYFIVILFLSALGVTFISGQPVPYFFLNFERLGWFRISSEGIGVAYWVVILLGLIIVIGFVLLKGNQWIRERNVQRG